MRVLFTVLSAALAVGSMAQVLRAEVEVDSTPSALANLQFSIRQTGSIERVSGRTAVIVLKTDAPYTVLREVRRARGVVSATPLSPMLPRFGRRVSSIDAARAESKRYRTEYALYHRAKFGDDTKPSRTPSVNYIDSYLHYLEERSFPNNFFDPSTLEAATAHRDQMPRAEAEMSGPETVGTWQFVGPRNLDIPYRIYYGTPPLAGRTNALAYHPTNPSIMYIGAAQGGVWKTTDGGVNWTPLSDQWERLMVNAIAIDPVNPETIYVGTGDFNGGLGPGWGIMKSTNGGATWSNIGRSAFIGASIRSIVVDPTNSNNILVASGYGANELFRSTNAGSTWSVVESTVAHWCDLVVSPSNAGTRTYWAAAESVDSATPPRIVRSQDNGATWTTISIPGLVGINSLSLDLAVSPTNPNRVYVLAATAQKLFRSDNNGATWVDLSSNFSNSTSSYNWSQASYDWHMVAGQGQGGNDTLYIGLIDLMQSTDNGVNWRSVGGPTYDGALSVLHNDQHSMVMHPTNPNEALVGCDGGVFRFVYNPTTQTWQFIPLNTNLGGTTQFYHASFHPTNRNFLLGGTQDNASPVSKGDLQNWDNVGGGDGAFTTISRTSPNIQATTAQFLSTYATTNSWTNSFYIGPNYGNDSAAFIAPIAEDPSNSNQLYGGTNYLYRYTFSTGLWENRLGGTNLAPSGGNLRTIAVAPSNTNVIYTGSSTGDVFVSVNRGSTWRRIDGTVLPNRGIRDITVHPTDPNDIILGLSGSTGVSRAWRCANTSAATPVWTSVGGSGSSSLPDIALLSIERDYRNPTQWWWGANDVGVFRTLDGGTTWQNATQSLGLPTVRVDEVKTIPGTQSLYAATHGRGIWRIDIGSTSLASVSIQEPVYTLNAATVTVSLTNPAPQGGAIVSLVSTQPGIAPVPPSVLVPAGQNSTTFTFTPGFNLSNYTVTIQASMNGVNQSDTVTVIALTADINRDGEVGPADFSLFALAFGSFQGDANYSFAADIDQNGEVGPSDFSILVQQFGMP